MCLAASATAFVLLSVLHVHHMMQNGSIFQIQTFISARTSSLQKEG